jgi:hypothetical protein
VLPLLAIAAILSDEQSALRADLRFPWFLGVQAGILWAARLSLAPQFSGLDPTGGASVEARTGKERRGHERRLWPRSHRRPA